MEMKEAGLVAEEAVETVEFQGKRSLALRLQGRPGEVRHPYWEGSWILYLDPDTHAMRGVQLRGTGGWEGNVVFVGELQLEGIRMPQVKTYVCIDDGTHLVTDVFTYVK